MVERRAHTAVRDVSDVRCSCARDQAPSDIPALSPLFFSLFQTSLTRHPPSQPLWDLKRVRQWLGNHRASEGANKAPASSGEGAMPMQLAGTRADSDDSASDAPLWSGSRAALSLGGGKRPMAMSLGAGMMVPGAGTVTAAPERQLKRANSASLVLPPPPTAYENEAVRELLAAAPNAAVPAELRKLETYFRLEHTRIPDDPHAIFALTAGDELAAQLSFNWLLEERVTNACDAIIRTEALPAPSTADESVLVDSRIDPFVSDLQQQPGNSNAQSSHASFQPHYPVSPPPGLLGDELMYSAAPALSFDPFGDSDDDQNMTGGSGGASESTASQSMSNSNKNNSGGSRSNGGAQRALSPSTLLFGSLPPPPPSTSSNLAPCGMPGKELARMEPTEDSAMSNCHMDDDDDGDDDDMGGACPMDVAGCASAVREARSMVQTVRIPGSPSACVLDSSGASLAVACGGAGAGDASFIGVAHMSSEGLLQMQEHYVNANDVSDLLNLGSIAMDSERGVLWSVSANKFVAGYDVRDFSRGPVHRCLLQCGPSAAGAAPPCVAPLLLRGSQLFYASGSVLCGWDVEDMDATSSDLSSHGGDHESISSISEGE